MQTKLTLRLDSNLIQSAKLYSKQRGKSLSQIVADYFALLASSDREETTPSSQTQLPPVTQFLSGLISGAAVSEEDYKQHLEDKYL